MTEHKFQIGDIVRHKAAEKYTGTKMLIVGRGWLESQTSKDNIYYASIQHHSGQCSRDIVFEIEIELFVEKS